MCKTLFLDLYSRQSESPICLSNSVSQVSARIWLTPKRWRDHLVLLFMTMYNRDTVNDIVLLIHQSTLSVAAYDKKTMSHDVNMLWG